MPTSTSSPASPQVSPLFRWVLTGSVAALFVLIVVRAAGDASGPIDDPDTWWHLVMGHKFLDGTSIRHPGPMSYFGTFDWHARDWLTQVVAARFDDWFGLPGVTWLYGFGSVVLAIVLFRISRARSTFVAAVTAMSMGMLGAYGSISPRPQLVSFIFLAMTTGAMFRTTEDLRPRWWLVPLAAVWACSHGFYFVAIGIEVATVAGLALDRRVDRRQVARLGLVPVLSTLAVGLTPNGIYQLTHPLAESQAAGPYILGYGPPSLSATDYVVTLAMLGIVALTWARRGGASWAHLAMVAVAAVFTFRYERTVALGAVILPPFVAVAIDSWLPDVQAAIPRRVERLLVYGTAVLALGGLALVVPDDAEEPSSNYPLALDDELDAIPDDAVVWNELVDGGYLAWRHPGMRIVGDGLSDQYPIQWLTDWLAAGQLQDGWEDTIERTGATYALLAETAPLRSVLEIQGWEPIAEGSDRVLLLKPGDP